MATSISFAGIRKALTPAFLGAVALVVEWISTDVWSAQEWRIVAATAVTAVAVYFVPNEGH